MSAELPPLLETERIRIIKKSDSKKRVFEMLAELLVSGQKSVTKNEIFDALISREKLGSTQLGNGIAIPRAKMDITVPRAALVFLKKGIQLDSPDKKDTRLFLAILIPEKEYDKYSNMVKNINLELAKRPVLDEISECKNRELIIKYFDRVLKPETTITEEISS